ncbi:GlsB/YeaQ/YmgE family stress response membrane protein [Actinoplanes solisilvae]|uniref:GlsB/YeaQ/YmgE family stress response membrane protein n=1 Tax=Actinoplanes solisilvae TaxID=2486853 RepID=UPI000FD850F5|nr:GlsB/YeaQ/YmgE family stress response membrane protein [Actinoplanes solisilvae]
MTLSSLVTALAVGTVLGLGGRWIVPAGRVVPVWVTLAVGIGAAVLATVVARLAGVYNPGVSLVEVVLQVIFAASGVALVAATADRPYNNGRGNVRRSR